MDYRRLSKFGTAVDCYYYDTVGIRRKYQYWTILCTDESVCNNWCVVISKFVAARDLCVYE